MYDYWMLIVGGIVGIWGVWGLITGSTTIYYRSHSGWGGHRPLFTYQGRGLAWVMTLVGGLLAGLYLLSHGSTARITPASANSIAGILLVGGILLMAVISILQGIGLPAPGRSPKKVQGVSLRDAALYLNMSEAELLQTAQNGGIESEHTAGTYTFRPDVLASFRDSMQRLNDHAL